jgi:hypothetical protein
MSSKEKISKSILSKKTNIPKFIPVYKPTGPVIHRKAVASHEDSKENPKKIKNFSDKIVLDNLKKSLYETKMEDRKLKMQLEEAKEEK